LQGSRIDQSTHIAKSGLCRSSDDLRDSGGWLSTATGEIEIPSGDTQLGSAWVRVFNSCARGLRRGRQYSPGRSSRLDGSTEGAAHRLKLSGLIVANQPVHHRRGSSSECGPVRWWRHSIPSLGLNAAYQASRVGGETASGVRTEESAFPASASGVTV